MRQDGVLPKYEVKSGTIHAGYYTTAGLIDYMFKFIKLKVFLDECIARGGAGIKSERLERLL